MDTLIRRSDHQYAKWERIPTPAQEGPSHAAADTFAQDAYGPEQFGDNYAHEVDWCRDPSCSYGRSMAALADWMRNYFHVCGRRRPLQEIGTAA